MGGFKQELIAEQVEVGDRVPQPRPWYSHAALTRRNLRNAEPVTMLRRNYNWRTFRLTMTGVLVGIAIGVFI